MHVDWFSVENYTQKVLRPPLSVDVHPRSTTSKQIGKGLFFTKKNKRTHTRARIK